MGHKAPDAERCGKLRVKGAVVTLLAAAITMPVQSAQAQWAGAGTGTTGSRFGAQGTGGGHSWSGDRTANRFDRHGESHHDRDEGRSYRNGGDRAERGTSYHNDRQDRTPDFGREYRGRDRDGGGDRHRDDGHRSFAGRDASRYDRDRDHGRGDDRRGSGYGAAGRWGQGWRDAFDRHGRGSEGWRGGLRYGSRDGGRWGEGGGRWGRSGHYPYERGLIYGRGYGSGLGYLPDYRGYFAPRVVIAPTYGGWGIVTGNVVVGAWRPAPAYSGWAYGPR